VANLNNSIFSDRRNIKRDRRNQNLPMPAGQDRRADCRRSRSFQSAPWWLNIEYAEELVSEKAAAELSAHALKNAAREPANTND
jgi:hypothetical protein